ncbi:MAG TPA: hypothetical protein VFZ75_00255 [Actinomycetota bacterium]|nr:hypothetical protein [Actinomycetota bacterium]
MDVTDPLGCSSAEEWRRWLERHHDVDDGVWLVISKKHATTPGVGLVAATEEALCFGWIDSAMRPVDDETYVLRFTPRRAKSAWSEVNRARAERLMAEGRMTEAGLARIVEAKRDGRWDRVP